MTLEYTSRAGKTYYLHVGKTKTGRRKFYFSTKREGELATSIPEGYEIYENPNAQVFLRKIQPKIIADDEIKLVEDELRKHMRPKYYKTDVKRDTITIYEVDQNLDGLKEIIPFTRQKDFDRFVEQHATYSPMLRFILNDREKRLFIAERYCFLGSINDWIFIGGPEPLEKLSKRFVRHLGKESFFELY